MADGNFISSTTPEAFTQVRGEINAIKGEVYILRPSGEVVAAESGMKIYLNDTLTSRDDSSVLVTMPDQGAFALSQNQKLVVDRPFLERFQESEPQDAAQDDAIDIAALEQAIASGQSLEELLPAAAAGGDQAPGGEDSESLLVFYQRTGSSVIPVSGFETNGLNFSGNALINEFGNADANNQLNANTRPVAQNDAESGDENAIISGTVAATDEDGTIVGFNLLGDVSQGTLTFNETTGEYSYDPGTTFDSLAVGETAEITFTYTAIDDNGEASDPATVTLTINGTNDLPVAVDDVVTTAEDTPLNSTIDLDTNDTDIDGDSLSVTAGTFTTTQGGTIVIAADGSYTYTPAADFNGDDSVDYTVVDGNGGSDTGTLTITVTPVNDNPVAADDSASTAEDTPLSSTLDLDANDIDVDGDSLTVSPGTFTTSQGGSIVIAADGSYTYTPPANFVGNDTVDYTVVDGNGGSDIGTLTVAVGAVNDAPVAVDDTATTTEDTPFTSTVGLDANDTDLDGDTLTVTPGTFTTAQGGSIVIAADGSYTYTPAANFAGTDTVDYTVLDGNGGSDTGTLSITVTPVNDAPVAVDDAASTAEDTPLVSTVDLDANDTDLDGDSLSVTAGTFATAQGGTIDIAADGSYTYTPPADFIGDDTVDYTVVDGNGGSDTATLTISVTPVNDAPVAVDDTASTAEDTPLVSTVDLDANDSDPDSDSLSVTPGTFETAQGGSIVIAADGSYTYTPAANFAGTDTVEYTLVDGNGGSDTGTLTITVTPVNDAPVVSSNTITVDEDSQDTGLGLTAPTDADGDTTTITVTGLPTLGTVTLADGTPVSDGDTLTPTELAGLQYDAPADYDGVADVGDFTYSVDDGQGAANSVQTGTVDITVTPVNDAPVVSSNTITVDEESEDTSLGLTAPTDADGDATTITVTGLPTLGTVTLADGTPVSDGDTLTPAELAGLQYDAPADYDGVADVGDFTYSVDDGQGAANSVQTGSVDITVTPVNDAPVVSSNTITVDEESEDTSLGLTAPTDADGDTTTITVTGLPTLGTVTLADGTPVSDGDTLTPAELAGLQYDAPANYDGVADVGDFTYSVDDGQGAANSVQTGSVDITVTPVNDAPVVSSNTITVDEESEDTSLGLTAPTDADGDTTIITVTGLPTLGTVTLADGTPVSDGDTLSPTELAGLQYDAPADYDGVADVGDFTYSVDDGQGAANSVQTGTVDITVTPVNDAPVVSSNTITVDEESEDTSLGLTAPTDADGDTTTITVTGLPTLGTVTLADGTPVSDGDTLSPAELAGLQYDAPADYDGVADVGDFTYSVDDGQGAANSVQTGSVDITVTPVNDAPVVSSNTITVAEDSQDTSLGLSAPTDADGDTTTITVTGLPNLGSVTLADGTPVSDGDTLTSAELAGLQYDAPADYDGVADVGDFTYSVDDGQGAANSVQTGSVDITVTPDNDAPVVSSNTITVAEESEDTSLGLTAPTDADGDTLTITVTGLPTLGAVTLADGTPVSDGDTLTPAELAGLQYDAPTDYDGVADVGDFTYSVDDGQGAANSVQTGTVDITVTPVNDAPVAVDDTATTAEDTPLVSTVDLDANDSDPDGDSLSVTPGTFETPQGGSIVIAADGSYTYTPAANFAGTDTVEYTLVDGNGGSDTGTLTITVTPVNDAPVVSSNTITVDEDSQDTGLGLTAPTDADGDTTTITVTGLPTLGTVTLADGTPVSDGDTLTPTELAGLQYDAPADYDGVADVGDFTYSVDDGQGAANSVQTGTVDITVTPVNDAPVVSSNTITVDEESEDTSLGLTAPTDADGDATTITVTGLPTLGTVTLADGTPVSDGDTLTPAELAGLQYDAPANYDGVADVGDFTYSVDDGQGAANSVQTGSVDITVTPVNDAPVVSSNTITVDEESEDTSLGLTAPTDADGDATTITVTGLPTLGTVTLADGTPVSDGDTLTPAELAGLQYDAPADYDGVADVGDFTYSVDDGQGAANSVQTGSVDITVTPVNDAPVVSSNTITVDEESEDTSLGLTAPTDADGDTTIITVTGLPTLGTVTLADGTPVSDGDTLTPAELAGLQYDAPTDYDGVADVGDFTYSVDDGQGAANSVQTGSVDITVTPDNDAPVVSSNTITVAEESEDTSLGLTAPTDADGDTLTITVTGLPTLGAVTLADGTHVSDGDTLTPAELAGLQYDAPADYDGVADVGDFTYSVDDGQGAANSVQTGTVDISVTTVNDPPSFDLEAIDVVEGTVSAGDVIANISNVSDPDGDTVSLQVINDTEGYFTLVGNEVRLTAEGADAINGEDSPVDLDITVEASDGVLTSSVTDTSEITHTPDLSLSSAFIPPSTGLTYSIYDDLRHNDSDSSTIEAATEGVAATSAVRQFDGFGLPEAVPFSDPVDPDGRTIEIVPRDVHSITGLIYLEAGSTYEFMGYRDDSIRVELGGETMVTTTGDSWGNYGPDESFSSETFTPTESGYYTFEAYVNNIVYIGQFSINLVVDGVAHELNASNFNMYTSLDDVINSGGQVGAFEASSDNPDGGFFPSQANTGVVDTPISLLDIAVTPNDGTETISSVTISGIPAGATLSDGSNSATGASVDVTSWDLNNIEITPPAGFTGEFDLTVTATAEETSNGATASTSTPLTVTVVDPVDLVGSAEGDIANGVSSVNDTLVRGTSGDDTLSASSDENTSVIGLAGDDTLTGGDGRDYLSGGAGDDNILGGDNDDIIFGGTGSDSMTGGDGSNTFAWQAADADGSVDTITDFTEGSGGDVLDFSDLLEGEDAASLSQYLSISSDTVDTTITVDADGTGGDTDLTIVIEGVDLLAGLTPADALQQLIDNGNLNID